MDDNRQHLAPVEISEPDLSHRPEPEDGDAWGTDYHEAAAREVPERYRHEPASDEELDAWGPPGQGLPADEPATIVDLDDDEVTELAQGVFDAVVQAVTDSLLAGATDHYERLRLHERYLQGVNQGASLALATFLRAMDAMADEKAERK